jgi:membrane fusion protein (multidrug efflux system)
MTEPTAIEASSAAATTEFARQAVSPVGHETITGAAARPHQRSLLWLGLGALALIILAAYLYVPGFYEVGTDDAYIDAHVVSVGPKVSAYVTTLHVTDNSAFKAGDLLIELDPRDFQVAVDSAEADLKSAEATVANIEAQLQEQQAVIGQNEAAVEGDRSTLEFAQQELQRYSSLANTGIGTVERMQQAQSDIGQRQAGLRRDLAALAAAKAQVAVLDTQRQQALAAVERQKAALAQARLNLSYTKIYATEDGTVANKTVEVGNFVQPGQIMFSAVPTFRYVTANYKETQLTHVQPGQSVTVRVDAYPSLPLHGHVDSIQRGTGSEFALLPPENATGNFVKVVQRVPVKIVFDDPPAMLQSISPGMSVETRVWIADPPAWVRLF